MLAAISQEQMQPGTDSEPSMTAGMISLGRRPHVRRHVNPSMDLPSVLGGPSTPHLPDGRILLPQPHDDDAVGLTDAALRPRGQRVVCLVEDDPVDVLLLAQPAGQTVLVDTEGDGVNSGLLWAQSRAGESQHTCPAPQLRVAV